MTCGFGSAELTINGINYILSGAISVVMGAYIDAKGNHFEVSAKENHSANTPVTPLYKPISPKADISITAGSGPISDIARLGCFVNATVKTGGRTFLFTGAFMMGTASVSSENGEISGLSITGGKFRERINV